MSSYTGAGKKFMDVVTYTGNGSEQSIGGLSFSPDLIWVKNRNSDVDHILFDSVRGFGANKELVSNGTYTEGQTGSGAPNTDVWGYVKSATSDGFVVNKGSNGNGSVANTSGQDYVAWCWDAGDETKTIAVGGLNDQVFNIGNWSSNLTSSSGVFVGDKGNAFDGDLTTKTASSTNNGQLVFTPSSPITGVTKVETYRPSGTQSPDNTVQLNDGTQVPFAEGGWTVAYQGSATTLTSLTVQGSSGDTAFLGAIRINDRILLQSVNNSQNWTSTVQGTEYSSGYPVSAMFTGGTLDTNGYISVTGQTTTWTPVGGLDVQTSFEVFTYGGGNLIVQHAGGSTTHSVVGDGEYAWSTISVTGPVTSVSWDTPTINGPYIYAWRVDGVILADPGSGEQFPSIETTVRANKEAGFSVVRYVGDGGNTASQVAHGLGRQPKFMMVKNLDRSTNWEVYHDSTPGNLYYLNTTDAKQTSATFTGTDANIINVGDTVINATGENIVAYVWSEIPGYSKFGKYEGRGTSGSFVYTGFKTRWVMMKNYDVGGSWVMYDTQRDPNGTGENWLYANTAAGEVAGATYVVQILSNGFRLVGGSPENNGDGGNYIYMAFADQPFKKAQKKRLEFSNSQDFREILNQDELTQYPNTTANGTVDTQDRVNNTIDVYTDGTGSDFQVNAGQTFTKPVTPPSSKRWTWTAWVKRSGLGSTQVLYGAKLEDQNYTSIYFDSDDKLRLESYHLEDGGDFRIQLKPTELFQDPSAWMHLVVSCNTIVGEAKIYINGELVTDYDNNFQPPVGSETCVNKTGEIHQIGDGRNTNQDFSGYLADIQFIDGQAMTPDEFVYNNENRENQLYPMSYSEWYGTRGYHLDFANPSDVSNDSSTSDDDWDSVPNAFAPVTYTGNGGTQSIDVGFPPDLVWIKSRSNDDSHYLFDSIRPVGNALFSNATSAAYTYTNLLTSLNSDGFSIGGGNDINRDAGTFVAWCWKSGDTTVTNNDGTLESQVRSNGSFSVVKFNVGTSSPFTVGHGLTRKPDLIISKAIDINGSWSVYHSALGATEYLRLNEDIGADTQSYPWGDTEPTSTVFTGSNLGWWGSNFNHIAYCFAETPGVSSFGSYTGDSGNAVTVDCGFEPAFVLVKGSSVAGNWNIFDTQRNNGGSRLWANLSDAEATDGDSVTFNSNGFTINSSSGVDISTDGATYIYAAFAQGSNLPDTVVDTPNNYGEEDGLGGEVRGNYATLNPLITTDFTYSDGNLELSRTTGTDRSAMATIGVSDGKWYWETTVNYGYYTYVGVTQSEHDTKDYPGYSPEPGVGYEIRPDGSVWAYMGTIASGGGNTATGVVSSGDTLGLALDLDSTPNTINVYVNGALQSNLIVELIPTGPLLPALGIYEPGYGDKLVINFGQTPFKYPAPIGFKTLNTTNIEDGLVVQGNTQMDVVTYTGNGSTQSIGGLNFSPDLVWTKLRDGSDNHALYDTLRGPQQRLQPSDSSADSTQDNALSSFNSDGWTIGNDSQLNESGKSYVAWAWNAGDGNPVLNTAGSIASNVKANPLAGFSVVKWSIGSNTNYTVGHGLGIAPSMIITKSLDVANSWRVWHKDLDQNYTLYLDTTNGQEASSNCINGSNSSLFSTIGPGTGSANTDAISYCFAEVPGYSSIGSYVGTGYIGKFINIGFKPRWIMIKRIDGSSNWNIRDTERDQNNPANHRLMANESNGEDIANGFDLNSNGFYLPDGDGDTNFLDGQFIYMAFAENPIQYLPQ